MARRRQAPTRVFSFRLLESIHAEMVLLKPELQNTRTGYTKYGAISGYLNGLIRQDLDRIKDEIREANKEQG